MQHRFAAAKYSRALIELLCGVAKWKKTQFRKNRQEKYFCWIKGENANTNNFSMLVDGTRPLDFPEILFGIQQRLKMLPFANL